MRLLQVVGFRDWMQPSMIRLFRALPVDDRTDDRTSLEPALDRLPPREREILRMRFEDGLTQTQIAEQVGISPMHVSRLIRRSLDRMREQLT